MYDCYDMLLNNGLSTSRHFMISRSRSKQNWYKSFAFKQDSWGRDHSLVGYFFAE
uniref:Uncharacterized protein n=1 Tax=Cruciviridae sp. TaxID=1955495 RepID=A0A1S6LVM4_9VIRU|nr:hypothetical protein [Cruciviridae sp.]